MIFLDVTDFEQFLKLQVTPTGIERVTQKLITGLKACCDSNKQGAPMVVVVWNELVGGYLPFEEPNGQNAIARRLFFSGRGVRLRQAVRRTVAPFTTFASRIWPKKTSVTLPSKDDVVFLPGAFWNAGDLRRFEKFRNRGAKVYFIAYDLIPLHRPDFVVPAHHRGFSQLLSELVKVATGFVCISQHARDALARFMADHGAKCDLSVVPLAHEFPPVAAEAAPRPTVRALAKNGFVVCVGTLDRRKNTLALLQVWQKLVTELGEAVPPLVLAGKMGWQADGSTPLLDAISELGVKVLWIDGPEDADLQYLYSNAAFSIFPSHYEGWGLPVGESLWFGRPCISSNASSLPEVAEGFVDLIDPNDPDSWLPLLRRFLTDPAFLDERVQRLRGFVPRTWKKVAEEVYQNLTAEPRLSPLQARNQSL